MEFDFASLPPNERYRLLIGSVVPRPIALVTTRDEKGVPNAAPFSFFNCFSHDPPIVALGMELRPEGGLKDTVRIIRATREFVVNLVSEEIAERMNICAVDFPEGMDELAEANLTAAPFSFFNCFSHDPPIVALGMELRPDGRLKDTVRIVRATREFVVNLVSEEIAERMNICAVDFPEGMDELAEAGLTVVASSVVKPPRIEESPVNMECKLIEELRFGEGGKRSIVLGEVLRFHVRDEVLTPRGHIDLAQMKPVGRLAGSGYVRLSDPFDIKRMSYTEWQARKRDA